MSASPRGRWGPVEWAGVATIIGVLVTAYSIFLKPAEGGMTASGTTTSQTSTTAPSPTSSSSSAFSPTPKQPTPKPQPTTGIPNTSPWANLIGAPGSPQGIEPDPITGAPGSGCSPATGSVSGYRKVTCHTGHASTGLQRQGVLGVGNQWVLCQQDLRRTNPVFQEGQTNSWWFWTLSDNGIWDWFPETALKEGGSDNPANGIPPCNPGGPIAR